MNSCYDGWKEREPWIVQDPESQREWLVPQPLRYFVHRNNQDEWMVIDRWNDIPLNGKLHTSRNKAIREAYKAFGRKLPTGEKIPECPNANHIG